MAEKDCYISTTNDLKIFNGFTLTKGTQLASSGIFYVSDDFYTFVATGQKTTVERLKYLDDLAFSTPTGTPNGNFWTPLGAFVLQDNICTVLNHTDPRPYDWTIGGIRVFVAEPMGKIKIYHDATVNNNTTLCSGVHIIREVPITDYIDILRTRWPEYYPPPAI
jgi:hypothetical protein